MKTYISKFAYISALGTLMLSSMSTSTWAENTALSRLDTPSSESTGATAQAHEPDGGISLEDVPEYNSESDKISSSTFAGASGNSDSSGFYIRGSLGGSFTIVSKLENASGATFKQSIGNAVQATGSFGYAINDILRLEGELGYLGNLKFTNLAGQDLAVNGMVFGVNAFADLGTIVGITPYVGGGLGGVKLSGAAPRLRFNAQAGFAYKVNQRLSLEFGYEFSRISKGEITFNEIKYQQNQIDSHMVKIGTRIKF